MMRRFFSRFLVGMMVVSVPMAVTVGYIHHTSKPDLSPVAIPDIPSPYERRKAAENRAEAKLRDAYMRGYNDAIRGRKAQP